MRRREFITILGGAAAWPLTARAQQPTKLPIVGFLGAGTLSAWSPWVAAFVQRLRELGWTEGRTIRSGSIRIVQQEVQDVLGPHFAAAKPPPSFQDITPFNLTTIKIWRVKVVERYKRQHAR